MSPRAAPGPPGRRALLLGLLALAGCGFAPAYGPGGAGAALRGRVAVEAPATADGFAFRARIEDRLGRPGTGALGLSVALSAEADAAAVTRDGAITRYDLVGEAAWRLLSPSGGTVAAGTARGFAGSSATGSTIATRAAEEDARARLMAGLADEVVARLLLLPPEALAGSGGPP